jgi:hypothetical protein
MEYKYKYKTLKGGNKVVLYIENYNNADIPYLLKDLDKEVKDLYVIKNITNKNEYNNGINIIVQKSARIPTLSTYPEGEYFIINKLQIASTISPPNDRYKIYNIQYAFDDTIHQETSHNLKYLIEKIKKVGLHVDQLDNKNNEYVKIYEETKKIRNEYCQLTDKLTKIRNIMKNNISDTEKIKQISILIQ